MNLQSELPFESSLSSFACEMAEILFASAFTDRFSSGLSAEIIKKLPAEVGLLHGGVVLRTIVLQQCAFDLSQFAPEDVALSASIGVAAAFGVSKFFRQFSEDEISARLFDYMGGKMPDVSDAIRFAYLFSRFVVEKVPFWWLITPTPKQKECLFILERMAARVYREANAMVIEKSHEFVITEADTVCE